ncbi:hypothetical protein PR048_006683 [Dryococelus australis]|uniref:DUF4371 domain-containing protein n=1 Tax=Dryococelus australis TaxID=614101 RepID=A0ABQ9IBP7_9NEOP|nr:hypothetical protein PR048_006683 [Dryococelus australis]
MSPDIQNQVIDAVNDSECFNILADETTDAKGIEQLSLCARYVNNTESCYVDRQGFLKFVPVYDLRGSAFTWTILRTLKKINHECAITGLPIINSSVIPHSCSCSLWKQFSKFSFDSSLQPTRNSKQHRDSTGRGVIFLDTHPDDKIF